VNITGRRADTGGTMRIRKNHLALCGLILLTAASLPARVVFDGLDLSADDRLLFRARSAGGGAVDQSALFMATVTDLKIRQLTAFPEKIDVLEGGRTLQVRNAFGALRLNVVGGLPAGIPGFPSFMDGAPALGGRVEDMAPSADGKWILYVEPVSAAYGNLVLIDAATGKRTPVSRNVERPGRVFPAQWSPDSRVFVYAREGRLYYQSSTASPVSSVDERYRLIGDGLISSIYWGATGDFFYIRGSTVYRVRSSELFARALYADFLEIGQVSGKIPFEFDANFDEFWVAPDSRSLLLSKGGRNLFYYPLNIDDYAAGFESSLPYLLLPRSCSDLSVLWSPAGLVTVIVSLPRNEGKKILVYRLDLAENVGPETFYELETPVGAGADLSPDGTRALIWGAEGAALYDYVNWKALKVLGTRKSYAARWLGNEDFILADEARIERMNVAGKKNLVCLAAADRQGYQEKTGLVLAMKDGLWFGTDGRSPWKEIPAAAPRAPATAGERYRVYLEQQASGPYENLPMIRNVSGVGTTSLLLKNGMAYDELPKAEDPPPDVAGPFNHGRRTGLRDLSLTFDLIDDAEGLPFVLDTLGRFGIRATFFLNGEFIRRHPAAAREIAEAGHETASLFFAPIDLSDSRYSIDAEFIRRGLARNEDEFYQASGYELALLWHAPHYAVSPELMKAAASVGYTTLGRDLDPLDWVSRSELRRAALPYLPASALTDRIMELKKPGSIIPIRLGVPSGGRDDYLFGRLDVLLDALVRAGYRVVPVSTLIERAK